MKKLGVLAALALCAGSLWAAEMSLVVPNVVHENGEYTLNQEKASRYGHIRFKLQEPYQPNKILTFEYRMDDAKKFLCLAIGFQSADKKNTYNSAPPSGEWVKYEIPFDKLIYTKGGGAVSEGDMFIRLNFYGRISDKEPESSMRVQIRNITIQENPNYDPTDNCKMITKDVIQKDGAFVLDQKKQSRFGSIFFLLNQTYDPGKRLVFEYRVKDPKKFTYVAVGFRGKEKRTFQAYSPKEEWTKVELPFSKLRCTAEKGKDRPVLTPEDRLTMLQIYARIADSSPESPIFLELRNVRILPPAAPAAPAVEAKK